MGVWGSDGILAGLRTICRFAILRRGKLCRRDGLNGLDESSCPFSGLVSDEDSGPGSILFGGIDVDKYYGDLRRLHLHPRNSSGVFDMYNGKAGLAQAKFNTEGTMEDTIPFALPPPKERTTTTASVLITPMAYVAAAGLIQF